MKKSIRPWCLHSLLSLFVFALLLIFYIGPPTKLIQRVEPGSTYYTLYAVALVLGSLAFLRFTIPLVIPRWPRWLGLPTTKAYYDGDCLRVTTKGSTITLATILYAASAMVTGTTELWAIFNGDQPGERRSGTMFVVGLVFVGLSIYLLARFHHRTIESFSPHKYSHSYPAKKSALETTSKPIYHKGWSVLNVPWIITVTADFTTNGNPRYLPTISENNNGEGSRINLPIPLTSNVSRKHIAKWLTTGKVSPQLHALGVPYEQPNATPTQRGGV